MRGGRGEQLLRIARVAIGERLGCVEAESRPTELPSELNEPGAAFVTLKLDGELRGCIGSLEAWRPLAKDVAVNACAAAFDDPRFPPLGVQEFHRVRISVSVLTPPEEIPASSEEEVLKQLRPGEDGVLLEAGGHRGTFLPAVWEEIQDKKVFLMHLKLKAGLPPSGWPEGARVFRYQVECFSE